MKEKKSMEKKSMEKKTHSLTEYVSLLQREGLIVKVAAEHAEMEKTVKYISYDSTDVKRNTLFICKGAHFSKEYLSDALDKGAFVYISEIIYDLPGVNPPYIIVNDVRKAMALTADFYYNKVWEKLNLIGITGTKGKSTTVYFMKYILDDYLKRWKKPKSAVISSIDTYDGVVNEESHITTPEALTLHKHFNNAVKCGIEYLSMEVSSQALRYDRTLGIMFDVGCFLNIGEDHISDIEHPDFEDYLGAKLLLFEQCKVACVNLNSDHIDTILASARAHAPKVITFGLTREADIYGYDITVNQKNISFKVKCDSFDKEFEISIPGLFNIQNALAAIAMCYVLDIPPDNIYTGLKKAQVSGRMEVYTSKERNFSVIVDYAHNKMSFESLFSSTQKQFPGKKISIVFGCPGKKALGRRRELSEIAGKYSHKVFITEEDAGEEPVMQICEEIARHVKSQDCDYEIIVDRGEAIKEAIDTADDNTIILITGKGRETRQKRGVQYIEVPSDVEYVEKFLK